MAGVSFGMETFEVAGQQFRMLIRTWVDARVAGSLVWCHGEKTPLAVVLGDHVVELTPLSNEAREYLEAEGITLPDPPSPEGI